MAEADSNPAQSKAFLDAYHGRVTRLPPLDPDGFLAWKWRQELVKGPPPTVFGYWGWLAAGDPSLTPGDVRRLLLGQAAWTRAQVRKGWLARKRDG